MNNTTTNSGKGFLAFTVHLYDISKQMRPAVYLASGKVFTMASALTGTPTSDKDKTGGMLYSTSHICIYSMDMYSR